MNRGKNLLLIISPVVVTFLIYGFILFFLFQQGYSPSLFIRAGSQYVDTSVPVDLIPNNIGYDGQFYYGLSIDPVFNNNPSHGITLDYPHYRQQRIIYPVLVHLLSFGNSNLIPGMLIVVNFLSICILAALGGLFAQQNGKSPWYGLLFSLYPGFFVTFTRDLVEIVAGVFLLATVLAIYKKRRMTVLWLSLAVLSRETTLLFAIAVLIAAFIQKWKNWRFFLIPPLVYTVWQIFLYIKWGLNNGISLSNISFPFVGFSKFFITSINESHVIEILCTSFIILYLFFIVVRVKRKTPPLFLIIACILYCSLFFSLSSYVWTEFRAYLRAFYELYILGIVVLLNSQPNQLLFAWFSGYKRTSNNKQVLSDE